MAEKIAENTTPSRSALPRNEKKLNYTVLPIPENRGRFGFTFDVFTSRLGKLIYVNLLMLVFFTPIVALFFLREGGLSALAALGGFGDFLGTGYPASPDNVGAAESILLQVDTLYFALAIALSLFAAIGVSGGVYCVRKLLRSDDELKLFRDFFTGVKHGYLSSAIACVTAFAMLFACVLVWDKGGLEMALGGNAGLWITLRVLLCVVTAFVFLFALWLVAVGSNYKQNAWGLLKNPMALLIGTILQSVFFAVLAALPVALLFLGSIFTIIAVVYFMLLGFAVAALVWCSFADWAFDRYAGYTVTQQDSQETEKKKAVNTPVSEQDVMGLLLVEGKSEYLARAIQPITDRATVYALPATFDQTHLQALAESRKKLTDEALAYANAHANEEWYKKYNARFAERDKALTETDKNGKTKKFVPSTLG